ncbi:MAG TPA: hydroxyethylthiazole kinase [Candidatus Altiarchaeales archaeon]|nr:hydroxyethylthiazole kinase [Candidatus Altiarchaeales archaeon]
MEPLKLLSKIREQKPLIHHLTNWVTIYDCANVVRAFGALPVMAHAQEEVEEMTGIAGALVLNIGTLTPGFINSMMKAGKTANKKGIPVVLDVVGAGATRLRTESCAKLMKELDIGVLKGNAGEIGVLAGVEAEVRGVESISVSGDIRELAEKLAVEMNSTVAVTGKQDVISDGSKTYTVDNGHDYMSMIVGTGCMAASVIGCFTAVEADYAVAAASALGLYGLSAERAAEKSQGPGTFKQIWFDEIHALQKHDAQGLRIRHV